MKLNVRKWQIVHLKSQDQDQGSQPIIFSINRFTFFTQPGEIAQLEKIGKPHPHFLVNHLFFYSECVVQSRINLCQIKKLKRPKNFSVSSLKVKRMANAIAIVGKMSLEQFCRVDLDQLWVQIEVQPIIAKQNSSGTQYFQAIIVLIRATAGHRFLRPRQMKMEDKQ